MNGNCSTLSCDCLICAAETIFKNGYYVLTDSFKNMEHVDQHQSRYFPLQENNSGWNEMTIHTLDCQTNENRSIIIKLYKMTQFLPVQISFK